MLFLGLDVGGTKTKLIGSTDGDSSTFTISGDGANLQRAGLQAAATILAGLIDEAVRRKPQEHAVCVCAGVAGAGRSADQDSLAGRIREIIEAGHPEKTIQALVVHDAAIALEAAFQGESGIIVISGTGSVGFGRTPEGKMERVGGWGYLLGDEGSGNAIGVRGLRAVCTALDGGPDTMLRSLAAEEFGMRTIDDVITHVYGGGWPCQNMAPIVIRAARLGDDVAREILDEQSGRLADQIVWLARRRPDIEKRIALIGGLAGADYYQDMLSSALKERLPEWDIRRDSPPPVEGALRLARKLGADA
jgi:glucosamine kinase